MPHLHLTAEQKSMLSSFIEQTACGHSGLSAALERLLENIMCQVNVRRLELVDPENVRELLGSTFEVIKVRHLRENDLLSDSQCEARLEAARSRAAKLLPVYREMSAGDVEAAFLAPANKPSTADLINELLN